MLAIFYESCNFLSRSIPVACRFYGAMSILGGLSSIWSLTAISLERHAVIAGGLSANKRRFSLRTVATALVVLWASSIVLMLCPLFGWNKYVYEVRIGLT